MAKQEKKKTAKRRPAFEIASTVIKAGLVKRLELPVARIPTGMWLSLPVVVAHGAHEGPTIWLSAAVHGDELNGIPIIRGVLDKINPGELSGTILAIPIVNVFGLIIESRYLPDRRDLNRSFPGSPRGSLAAQLAHLFMTQIVSRCEMGIDYLTGSQGRTNLPQLRCDLRDVETLKYARAFGARVTLDATLRKGSLREATALLGIRMLVYEAGEAFRFHRGGIQAGIDGTMRVLREMGMIEGEFPVPAREPMRSKRSVWVRARRGGLCQMRASLGENVEKGQEIASIIDSVGRNDVVLRARTTGVLIGHINRPLVNRGDAVAHIAEVESF